MSGVGAVSSSHVDDDDSDTQRGDYQDYRPHVTRFKRYLVHDCCEFGNAESLRVSGDVIVIVYLDITGYLCNERELLLLLFWIAWMVTIASHFFFIFCCSF